MRPNVIPCLARAGLTDDIDFIAFSSESSRCDTYAETAEMVSQSASPDSLGLT